MAYRMMLADGTVLLRDSNGTLHTARVSEVIEDAEALRANGLPNEAKAYLLALGIWLEQLLARVEIALGEDGHQLYN